MRKLFKNISYLTTFDDKNSEHENINILVENNIIKKISHENMDKDADEIINCQNYLIMPGFVNTHHHFYQTLTRNVKEVQNAKLFKWLVFLYEKWKHIDDEAVYISGLTAMYEMLKTGVTTSTDHLYLYPFNNSKIFDSEIEAAQKVGMRFHPTRGSMSLSKKDGGLPPDSVVQTDEKIIEESIRVIKTYHNPSKYSMLRIALAPCSPFSVTKNIMLKTVELAEEYDVLIHTHLAETKDEDKFCLEKFGKRPVDYMEELGWLNPKVWFAHLVCLTDEDIEKLVKNDVGMAHCPSSNMRLGSGIAPLYKMKDKMRVGIAVDGSASNDTNNMIYEIRNALLLQRVKYGADAITSREVLKLATNGGASVLRMDDYIGQIKVGYAADFIGFNLNKLEFAGGLSDPTSAVIFCDAKSVDLSVINGDIRIKDGELIERDIEYIVKKHNEISKKILEKL
jgi:cytosine/adenosine deaminase-related metal-dependent hydrolase